MGSIKLKSNLQKFSFQEKPGYVTRAVTYSRISAKSFLAHVMRNSHIDKGTLYAATDAVGKEFVNLLCEGHSVEVPEIGIFRFSVNAKAVDTKDEAGAQTVYRRRIIYTPTVDLKKELLKVSLQDDSAASVGNASTETPKTPVEDENNG